MCLNGGQRYERVVMIIAVESERMLGEVLKRTRLRMHSFSIRDFGAV